MLDLWRKIDTSNTPATLFSYRGLLARLKPDPVTYQPAVQILDKDRVRNEVAKRVKCCIVLKDQEVEVYPPPALIANLMASKQLEVPDLIRVTGVPVFDRDGRLLQTPGYDERSGIYYEPEPRLSIRPVPLVPTARNLEEALRWQQELLWNFPFATDADRAAALTLELEPFAREMIVGATPLYVVEAPEVDELEAEGSHEGSQELVAQTEASGELVDEVGASAEQLAAMDLAALAREINKAHRAFGAAVRRSLRYALRAGQALRVVKARLPHGAFGRWVEENAEVSHRSASRYMLVVDRWQRLQAEKTANLADLTIERLAAPETTRRTPRLLAPPSPPQDAAPVPEGEIVSPAAEASTEPEATTGAPPQPSPAAQDAVSAAPRGGRAPHSGAPSGRRSPRGASRGRRAAARAELANTGPL